MKISLKPILILIPVAGLFFQVTGCGRPAGPPNIVWIISEDNSKHYMQIFDPNGIATPNIEAMAGHGILFSRAFSNAPVCSVARSTLESSCYAPRTGTQFHRKSEMVPLPEGVDMFPTYLRRAGYYTTNCSKEDYNYRKNEGVWDESSPGASWKNRQPGQPFFHKASYPDSHESRLHFPAELVETYEPVIPPGEVHVFPNHPDTELFRFTGAYYRDRILKIDTIVGDVLNELEEAGELENTFVFYFADHGGVLPGSKGYIYETGLHIPLVVRIPENYRHLADLPAGSESGAFVSFVDFGPTVLQLAGVEIPGGIDGLPFLGEGISSADQQGRDLTFGYADRFDEKYDLVRSVRKGNMKYMRNYQGFNFDGLQNNYRYNCLAFAQWRDLYEAGDLDEIQAAFYEAREPEALYDLEKDPYETRNLAGDPGYRESLLELRAELKDWVTGMPDLSFYPENVLRKEAFGNPVAFGLEHRAEIAGLVDVSDLQLLSFGQAREDLERALLSADPMVQYWALVTCSTFGKEAAEFEARARELCDSGNLLVRTRAAEFLGLAGLGDPLPVIAEALNESDDPVEALLILNSLVMLTDGPAAFSPDLGTISLQSDVAEDAQVSRRMEYLEGKWGSLQKN